MKILTLSAICMVAMILFIPAFLTAQDKQKTTFNNKKLQLNIAVENIFARSTMTYYVDPEGNVDYSSYYSPPQANLLVGLKFHDPKGAARLGFILNYNTYKSTDEDGDESRQRSVSVGIYAGYEWHATFNRVNVYYGFDLSPEYSGWKTTYESGESKSRYFSISGEPLVGVNVFITPYLSVGTEAKLMFRYVNGKVQRTSKFGLDETTSEDKFSDFQVKFGPLGFLSINIHL